MTRSRAATSTQGPRRLGWAALGRNPVAWLCVSACWLNSCEPAPPPAPVELSGPQLSLAADALRANLGQSTELLELRASPERVHFQVLSTAAPSSDTGSRLRRGEVYELTYTFATAASAGSLIGPTLLVQKGHGTTTENAFSLAELNLEKIIAAWPKARSSVDPEDGKIEALVIRRFLPTSTAVRARIYVSSPRLSGHLDTDAQGVSLSSPAGCP